MSLRWRLILVGGTVLVLGFFAGANFVPEGLRRESALLPDDGLRLGLDLRGGIHWVLGADLDVSIERELQFLAGEFQEQFDEEDISVRRVAAEGLRLVVETFPGPDAARAREILDDASVIAKRRDEGGVLEYALDPRRVVEVEERGMLQVLEVLRRRIDDPSRGVPDSVVTRQGRDRVLVQIPGGEIDRERAAGLIKTTGHLEFKIVLEEAPTEDLLRARHPDGLPVDTEIAFERDRESDQILNAYLLPTAPDVTGEFLEHARVAFDRQQRPVVEFRFSTEGGRIFRELTGEHIQDRLAILLDSQVYSAPVIRSQIGRRGQIEGRFTSEEARNLAIVLRAGSLPVPVVIEEERTIGPALGADSIRSGVSAAILGLILVVAFSLGYYRLSGGYASFALLANLLMLIGIMSLFRTTLTLPGIAGLVLTVGMAVDANVIIFERIREELRGGRGVHAAVATGFSKALWTILDANITTLITALVLFQYGSGPIKGFAVTLSVGILTSVFAALVVTRLLFAVYPGYRPVESLSI